jgi:hypothetical protein
MLHSLDMSNATHLTNDELDAALDAAIDSDKLAGIDCSPATDALFAERSRRIAARQAEIAAAETADDVVRVKLTRAASGHVDNAIVGVEGYESVVIRTSWIAGTREQLAGIVSRLEDAAHDAEENIASASLYEISDEFLASVAKRQQKCIRKAVRAIERAIG